MNLQQSVTCGVGSGVLSDLYANPLQVIIQFSSLPAL
jgi:hypothetical protein